MPVSVVVLIAMSAAVLMLAVYRKVVARNEDDLLHLADGADPLIASQRRTANALSLIDRAGIALTVVTALYGVALVANYVYAALTAPSL